MFAPRHNLLYIFTSAHKKYFKYYIWVWCFCLIPYKYSACAFYRIIQQNILSKHYRQVHNILIINRYNEDFFLQRRGVLSRLFRVSKLIINGQAKIYLFGHWCFTTFHLIVFLTKIRFLDQNSQYSWLNSDRPQRFVSIGKDITS